MPVEVQKQVEVIKEVPVETVVEREVIQEVEVLKEVEVAKEVSVERVVERVVIPTPIPVQVVEAKATSERVDKIAIAVGRAILGLQLFLQGEHQRLPGQVAGFRISGGR